MGIRHAIVLFILISLPHILSAQNSSNSSSEVDYSEFSYFLADIGFANNAVFMGRADSIATPYLFPSFSYFNKSGFFASTSFSYLTRIGEGRVDLIWLSAGYLFDKKKFSAGISTTGYVYSNYSFNVQSQMLASLWTYLSYDFKIATLSFAGSCYLNDNETVDIFTGLILDHTFFTLDSNFLISPALSVYAGTQQFYEQYYTSSRMGNRKDMGKPHNSQGQNSPPSNKVSFNGASEFNVLNIEFSIPLSYYFNSFIISFTPYFSFPQSPATILSGEYIVKEELSNRFYFYVGIAYWF